MWVHGTSSSPGHWDEGVLEIIGGNREREGVSGLGLVTWISLEAAEKLGWSAGISSTDTVSIMVNDFLTLLPAPCLIPTIRYDRHALLPGYPLFIPLPHPPAHRCRLTTRADGLPYGTRH
jgi:hypothetical protein